MGVWEGQGECLFDLGYCLWVYGGRVVSEGVLVGVPVRTGGATRGLHSLRCEEVVEGDVVKAVDFRGPPYITLAEALQLDTARRHAPQPVHHLRTG